MEVVLTLETQTSTRQKLAEYLTFTMNKNRAHTAANSVANLGAPRRTSER